MKKNMTFQASAQLMSLIKEGARRKGVTASEYCRAALYEQFNKDGLTDDLGDPFVGVIDNG